MIKFHQVKEKSLFSHSSCQDMHVIICILNFGNCHGNVSLSLLLMLGSLVFGLVSLLLVVLLCVT